MSFTTDKNYQEFEPVILSKKSKEVKPTPPNGERRREDENEIVAPKKLGLAGREITTARVAKGMDRKKLAMLMSLHETEVRDYENGTVVPNRNVLNKFNKILGIKISW